jgi:hypothetical protein
MLVANALVPLILEEQLGGWHELVLPLFLPPYVFSHLHLIYYMRRERKTRKKL